MPWYNGDYPPSYKNQPKYLRDKAVEIANEVLKSTGNEGEAIPPGCRMRANILRNTRKKCPKKKQNNERLHRFPDAQQRNYATALAGTRGGRKRVHWMWHIFPQVAGLGTRAH